MAPTTPSTAASAPFGMPGGARQGNAPGPVTARPTRELQHAMEHAVLVARGPTITLADLPETLEAAGADRLSGPVSPTSAVPAGSLVEVERAAILKALDTTGWNKRAAAALLGVRRPALYSRMRRLGVPYRRGPSVAAADQRV